MAKFSKFSLRHASNGVAVQDGFDVYVVRDGGTSILAATSGENLSRLDVEIDDKALSKAVQENEWNVAVLPEEDDPIHSVGTRMINRQEVYSPKKLAWLRDHIGMTEDMTPDQTVNYLWDVVKSLHLVQKPGGIVS